MANESPPAVVRKTATALAESAAPAGHPSTAKPTVPTTAAPATARVIFSTDRETLESEVRIDTYRASGPGGQHVNKTNSAIRITHEASGVVVIAQDSSSQFRNKETAFERLIEKLKKRNHVPKKRFATKPTRASKERRIEGKKTRAVVKSNRSKKVIDD